MSRFMPFLVSILFGFASMAQAHFFAYQEWHNPATGQVVEEYYDLHYPDADPAVNPLQRKLFLERAKNYGNDALVIAEDMWSFDERKELNFDDASHANKQAIRKHMATNPSPRVLPWLYAECFVNNIPAFNMECRETRLENSNVATIERRQSEIASYNDTAVLNAFYASYQQHAQELTTLLNDKDFSSDFNACMLIVDARALHALHTTKAKHIMLAAGALHIVSVNNVLQQLGWIPGPLHVPPTLTDSQDHQAVTNFLVHKATKHHARVLHNVFEHYDHTVNTIKDHALDMTNPSALATTTQPAMANSTNIWQQIMVFINRLFAHVRVP